MDNDSIAILGGTGDQGLGLALRFTKAGRPVVIGSRKEERAVEAAEEVRRQVPGAEVSGFANEIACTRSPIVILSVPFEHMVGTVKGIKEELAEGQEGFLGLESVRGEDGEGITISYWSSREAFASWRVHPEHREAQERGRRDWYAQYRLTIVRIEESREVRGKET